MNEESEKTNNDLASASDLSTAITLKQFLQEFPISSVQVVSQYFQPARNQSSAKKIAPLLKLWCASEYCQGYRYFTGDWSSPYSIGIEDIAKDFLNYTCRDCGVFTKTFCILSKSIDTKEYGKVVKIGEIPEVYIDIPSYLPTLLGNDYSYFIKGLKCEKLGCGIGAFSYYRRVVENQKERFIRHIIKVAKRINVSQEDVKGLESAAAAIESDVVNSLEVAVKEIQFKKAVDSIKDFIPKSLYVEGQNPMTILHSALSIGLHSSDDETCLNMAHSIRIILQDFSQRIKDALREDTELKSALSNVMKFNQKK